MEGYSGYAFGCRCERFSVGVLRSRSAGTSSAESTTWAGTPADDLVRERIAHTRQSTYEITAQALRQRGAGNDSAGAIAARQYRTMDTEAIAFLDLCVHRAGIIWGTPVE
ncbi:hypothetical protein MLGJGCBP_05070 [Rhodococcus sp. T7]|nr:hypothetical protein MLGJGCBP_05070 [Rhodococcus sp. T7]